MVEAATLIDDEDTIKLPVDILGGLVDGGDGGLAHDVTDDTKGLDVIEGGGGIETTGGTIPDVDGGAGGELLGNGETLPLTTGDPTDKGVTDKGTGGGGETVHGLKVIDNGLNVGLLGGLKTLPGDLTLCGEGEGLFDSEGGMMGIVLLIVLDLTTVVLGKLLGGDTREADITGDALVGTGLVGEDTKEGTATRARATKDQEHLTLTNVTGQVVEDVPVGVGGAGEEVLKVGLEVEEVDEGGEEEADLGVADIITVDIEVPPGDAGLCSADPSFFLALTNALELFKQIVTTTLGLSFLSSIICAVLLLFLGEKGVTGELTAEVIKVAVGLVDVDVGLFAKVDATTVGLSGLTLILLIGGGGLIGGGDGVGDLGGGGLSGGRGTGGDRGDGIISVVNRVTLRQGARGIRHDGGVQEDGKG